MVNCGCMQAIDDVYMHSGCEQLVFIKLYSAYDTHNHC